MPVKELLNSIHDTVRWLGHVALIPVIAALNAVIAGATHVRDELGKI